MSEEKTLEVVETVEAKEADTVKEEKKIDLKKIGKIVVGAGLGAAALGTAVYKYLTRKKGGDYSDLPGSSDSSETAPTASESDFVE